MSEKEDIAKQIGDIERNIGHGEALFRQAGNASTIGWIFTVICILMIIFLPGYSRIIGLIILIPSVYRISKAEKYKREIEEGLREYRGRQAELKAALTIKD